MEIKMQGYKKIFDNKLPLIKQPCGIIYMGNYKIRKLVDNKGSILKKNLNSSFSSLSIIGLSESIKNIKKSNFLYQKNYRSIGYFQGIRNKNLNKSKKLPELLEHNSYENNDLTGWEINY
jgi:hypothetical protein